jgi:hypothetical protein
MTPSDLTATEERVIRRLREVVDCGEGQLRIFVNNYRVQKIKHEFSETVYDSGNYAEVKK